MFLMLKMTFFQIILGSDSALCYYADWPFKPEKELTFNSPVKDILVFFSFFLCPWRGIPIVHVLNLFIWQFLQLLNINNYNYLWVLCVLLAIETWWHPTNIKANPATPLIQGNLLPSAVLSAKGGRTQQGLRRHPWILAEPLSIKVLSASIVLTKEIEKLYLIVEGEQDNV